MGNFDPEAVAPAGDNNTVRFVRLRVRDYGHFRGLHQLTFNRRQTVIVGPSGSGRSTLADALVYLGPSSRVEANESSSRSELLVDVVTEGNRELIEKYSDLVQLGADVHRWTSLGLPKSIANSANARALRDEARSVFATLCPSLKGRVLTNTNGMSPAERFLYSWATAFAARKVLRIDLPAVFDRPFVFLDYEARKWAMEFLESQPCQQILFVGEEELGQMAQRPHHTLTRPRN